MDLTDSRGFASAPSNQRVAGTLSVSLQVSAFAGLYFDLDLMAELLGAITGHPFNVPELMRIGERILNLERLLNSREGVNRSTDRLPKRLLAEPLPDGPRKGSTVPLERLKDDFYETAGWDQATGLPTPETLRRLGLDEEMM